MQYAITPVQKTPFRMPENALCMLQMSPNRLVAGATPRIPLGSLQRSPDLTAGF